MTLPRIARVECDGFDYSLFATDDYVSQHVFRNGTWSRWQHVLTDLMLSGFDAPVVIDVGANIGLYTVPAAAIAAKSGGRVLAFEPQRIVFQQLCANVVANRLDNVWAHHQAVGSAPGSFDLPTFDYAKTKNIGGFSLDPALQAARGMEEGLDRSRTEPVEIVTLDSLQLPGRVRMVKIDVEGTEIDVIAGGRTFFEAHGFPPFLFEAWEDPAVAARRAALFAAIAALGYSTVRTGRDEWFAQHPDCDAQAEVRVEGKTKHMSRLR